MQCIGWHLMHCKAQPTMQCTYITHVQCMAMPILQCMDRHPMHFNVQRTRQCTKHTTMQCTADPGTQCMKGPTCYAWWSFPCSAWAPLTCSASRKPQSSHSKKSMIRKLVGSKFFFPNGCPNFLLLGVQIGAFFRDRKFRPENFARKFLRENNGLPDNSA